MASRLPDLKFFYGRSNIKLGKEIRDNLKSDCAGITYTDFPNGEIKVKYEESVRGDDVYLLQTSAPPTPEKWMMELFILAHTALKASAKRVTAVIPYIYGSRQDRKTEPRTPITIQLIGNLLYASGVKRIITVSLHNHASEAAFGKILIDNISSSILFYPLIERYIDEPTIIMSPDAGGVLRAKSYANRFNCDLGFCYKTREKGNNSIVSFVGDVDKKNVFIIDDMIDTATSLCNIIYKAKDKGANKIYACATHAILSGEAISKLVSSPVEKIFITNSICHSELPSKFQVANLSELLGKTIRAVNADKSVGELFEKESCV